MNIRDGMAENAIACTGADGLHAQAEPSWLPVWTVDEDDALWVAKGTSHDGRWELCCEPSDSRYLGPTLDVFLHSLTCKYMTFTPDQARAMRHALGLWLASLDATRSEA